VGGATCNLSRGQKEAAAGEKKVELKGHKNFAGPKIKKNLPPLEERSKIPN